MSITAEAFRAAWRASLQRVDAESLVAGAVHRFPATFRNASRRWLISVGKASPGMHRGARNVLGPLDRERVIAPHNSACPEDWDFVVFSDHPEPSVASVAAGRLLTDFADEAASHDDVAVYALVSGGASALCEVPANGLSLERLIALNREDLAAGLSIETLNAKRAQRSAIKGGKVAMRFGRSLKGAAIVVDVPSGRPEVVGSGLFALDGLPLEVLATPQTLCHAMADELRRRGCAPVIQPPFGGTLDELLTRIARWRDVATVGQVWVAAGEVSVAVPPHAIGRRGGRARHACLEVALMLSQDGASRIGEWLVFSAASDGCDGVDGAGAMITSKQMRGPVLTEARMALAEYRSGDFCARHGLMLDGHRARTNLCDVYAVARIG